MQGGAAPFTVIGTTPATSGSNATITWPNLTAGTQYEWYATVSDGSAPATSSTNTFTTAAQTYTLATNTVGNGTVTKSPDQASYSAGGIVNLTANPAVDSTFTGWSGDASGSTNPLNITMDGNKSITATFAINTFTLNYAAGTGGTLTGVTSQTVNYGEDGTAVTAVPNTGYHFVNWSDTSTDNPRTDTNITANLNVTANFAVNTFTLNYSAGAGGSLTGTTSQTVNYGEDGTPVEAVPNTGYHFVNWSDSSTANPRTDTNVTANVSVTANFAVDTFTLNYAAAPAEH
jgi:uncharacterized repeat protein (TIGR02543 family)